ncbi:Protein kinase domain-containing protein [Aphelenchoides fujianensis]|nr:Protein kinase domain-containing protein [Aphelenchoides fujianensis]
MQRILEYEEATADVGEPTEKAIENVADEIKRLLIGSSYDRKPPIKPPAEPAVEGEELKIKFQYLEEQAALNLKRPVSYNTLQDYFQRRFRRHLNMYYTTSSRELMIQIKNQADLDHVVQLHELSGSKRRLRLILARRRETDELRSSGGPPHGLYHGIQEAALSETSSIFSNGSTSYSSNRLNRFSSEEEPNGSSSPIKTPNPPSNWRESRCLGRGSFGHVFVCLNADTNEQLVVKKIYLNGGRRWNRVLSSLENEVTMLSTLSHPHIVQYHGCAKLPDCFCIFMEFMTGGTIKEQISEMGPISEGSPPRILQYSLPDGTSDLLRDTIKTMLQREPEKRPTAKQLMESPPFSYIVPKF